MTKKNQRVNQNRARKNEEGTKSSIVNKLNLQNEALEKILKGVKEKQSENKGKNKYSG